MTGRDCSCWCRGIVSGADYCHDRPGVAREAATRAASPAGGDVSEAISVIGLGKLGAPLAAALASKGFEVCGVDRKPQFVAALRSGRAPVAEPGLQDLLARAPVRASHEVHDAVIHSEVTFVVVPTPSTLRPTVWSKM